MSADVYSDDGYYAIVPEWILDADVSAQAVRLYAVLRRYADQRTMHAHPSRKTLAERLHVKDPKVVDRAVVELSGIGALLVVARWRDEDGHVSSVRDSTHREQTSNGYRLTRRQIGGEGSGADATPPRGPEGKTREAEKGDEPQPVDLQPEERQQNSARDVAPAGPSFEEFWAVYPRKAGKADARKAWLRVDALERGDALDGARTYRDDPNRDPQFTAFPATWLRAGRWEDDPLPARSTGQPSREQQLHANVRASVEQDVRWAMETPSQAQLERPRW